VCESGGELMLATTRQEPLDECEAPVTTPGASSGEAADENDPRERGEHWWPVASAILAVALMHAALPAQYRERPRWVVPVVLVVLLIALITGDPGRIDRRRPRLRVLTAAVIAFITLANLAAAIRLVDEILTNGRAFASHPGGLLATGGVIWATNIIAFALWYWDLDRGGAAERAHPPTRSPAFVFPEMSQTEHAGADWQPQFVDYLALAFWTGASFSPADVSPIRPWAKIMMMLEAVTSLVVIGLVIARAINIL
jgi:hypothetical protein